MRIETCTSYPDDALEKYRPTGEGVSWELVTAGYWSQDPHHSGYLEYYLAQANPNTWVLDSVARSAELDDVTEEDVEEGRLSEDQFQALLGTTLKQAQNSRYKRIAAICLDPPVNASKKRIAELLYEAVCAAGGNTVEDVGDGLLS